MNKSTTLLSVLQQVLSEEEVEALVELVGYVDKGRKVTVYTLLQYWAQAAYGQWSSYRSGVKEAKECNLPIIDYSTFSGKAAEVPFDLFKRVFHLLVTKCNRQTRRTLNLPKELLLIDSTTITAGKTRLPWAPYKKFRAGIKLHTALAHATMQPVQVVETIAKRNDAPLGEVLANPLYILVQDRAYGKIERLDRYLEVGQSFVIRLKDNLYLVNPRRLRRTRTGETTIVRDITCRIGQKGCQSTKRHRVVEFLNDHGETIRVVTDLWKESPEMIAEIYKARWQIEVFFRWIKQHLNVPELFGTTENAVYGQLYMALTVYVILKWLFDTISPTVSSFVLLTFWAFVEDWAKDNLPMEWKVRLDFFKRGDPSFSCFANPKFG